MLPNKSSVRGSCCNAKQPNEGQPMEQHRDFGDNLRASDIYSPKKRKGGLPFLFATVCRDAPPAEKLASLGWPPY